MSKSNNNPESVEKDLSESERLKAVRDLIFGDNMAEYQQEFAQIRDQIGEFQALSEKKLASESAALTEKLDALEHTLNQSVKKMQVEMDQNIDRLEGLCADIVNNRREVGQAMAKIAETLQK